MNANQYEAVFTGFKRDVVHAVQDAKGVMRVESVQSFGVLQGS